MLFSKGQRMAVYLSTVIESSLDLFAHLALGKLDIGYKTVELRTATRHGSQAG